MGSPKSSKTIPDGHSITRRIMLELVQFSYLFAIIFHVVFAIEVLPY